MVLRDYLVPLTLSVSALTAVSLPRVTFAELRPRPIQWSDDVVGSLLRAREEDKLVLVYFGAEWDCAAKELEHQTFPDPEVSGIVRSEFIAVHVNTTDEDNRAVRDWQELFKVVGDPTIVVLSRGGREELARFNEYVPPDRLATKLLAASDEPHSRGYSFRW